ncbi:MAG: TRAP transporter small permease [Alphaproteobacteria bacterium]|nr:TRAP transporter small permease [Alphaproteobacteria bacterium]
MAVVSGYRSPVRWLYVACGMLAACFMVAIAVLVLTSVILRLVGGHVPGLADYSGYCMAASSFLALGYAFGHGAHIRVSLVLQALPPGARRIAEIWCLGMGGFLASYLAYYSVTQVQISHLINDISQGPDATPLWIPQLGMAIGAVVFAIAIFDQLAAVLLGARIGPEELHPEDHE